jgi:hypothetical protein
MGTGPLLPIPKRLILTLVLLSHQGNKQQSFISYNISNHSSTTQLNSRERKKERKEDSSMPTSD